jgi:hypothetical protein
MKAMPEKHSPTDKTRPETSGNYPTDKLESAGLFRSVGILSAAARLLVAILFLTTMSFAQERPLGSSTAAEDSVFLDLLQHTAFDFFWQEANPGNGLIKDRSTPDSPCSIASVGFGLTAIGIAIDRGWITRAEGRDRTLMTLKTFWEKPQGRGNQGTIGYKGFFYHFLDMNTALRAWNSELSSIDSALLLAGILYAKQYFTAQDSSENKIRALADSIYHRVDWNWMRNFQPNLIGGWFPETGFINWWWRGYNEAMIMDILGLGSPTFPLPASTWQAWTSSYAWQTHYGFSYVNFPPLFGHQYSHCWIDFRNIQDAYMRGRGITYFENSRRATLAARAYCIANPGRFAGYGENVWGITASDGPDGYRARGAPPAQDDDGTIAPTAAGGAVPFAPEESIAALRHMHDTYRNQIWMKYGFRDAFNLTRNWWGPDVIGIDEGPIVVMIENYRTGRVWNKFMQNADIQRGLQRAGFTPVTSVEERLNETPNTFMLHQNFPNPFNPTTTFRFTLPQREHVTLAVFDLNGQKVATLVEERLEPGEHAVSFDARHLPSGIYFYSLSAGPFRQVRKAILMK